MNATHAKTSACAKATPTSQVHYGYAIPVDCALSGAAAWIASTCSGESLADADAGRRAARVCMNTVFGSSVGQGSMHDQAKRGLTRGVGLAQG